MSISIITKHDLLKEQALNFLMNYHYVYGMKVGYGLLTQSRLNTLAKDNPSVYDASYINQAKQYIGKLCVDCSGLVCAIWEISDIGSSQIADLPVKKSTEYTLVDLKKLKWGDCVWKRGHVGIYMGDDKVLEAKSIKQGVRVSNLGDTPWIYGVRKNNLHAYSEENVNRWCNDNGKWWFPYGESKGEYLADCTIKIDGKHSTFDSDGYYVG